MPNKVVIADSSVLIFLGKTNNLYLLKELYGEIFIPLAVFEEIQSGIKKDDVFNLIQETDWIRVLYVPNRKEIDFFPDRLHLGEREALVLYKNLNASLIILDDYEARTEAKRRGFNTTGIIGVIVKAKNDGIIPLAKPVIDSIVNVGFFVSPDIIDNALKSTNER